MIGFRGITLTYDHRLRNTGHPVRSAIHKPQIGRLVVGWVTTSEYLLLYVFFFSLDFFVELGYSAQTPEHPTSAFLLVQGFICRYKVFSNFSRSLNIFFTHYF
jgi:hypothetical protein